MFSPLFRRDAKDIKRESKFISKKTRQY